MTINKKIEAARIIYEKAEKWKTSDKTLNKYFDKNKSNDSVESILIKITLIDSLYTTNIKDKISVAKHILDLVKKRNLDNLIKEGNVLAVDEISNCNGKILLSFASKFCHFHNKKFFIYDSYVKLALEKIINWKEGKNRNFGIFSKKIEEFKEINKLNDISSEDVDKYLWLYGFKEKLNNGKKDLNKEIYQLYEKDKELFNQL